MRNRFVKLLVISLFLLLLVGCSRSEYTYNVNNNSIIISEYTGSAGYLKVPDSYEGKEVRVIDVNTYAYNINIYHARIGENIELIRECAFWYCYSLETIYIPKGVKIIEECAFYNCHNLKYVFYEDEAENVNIDIAPFNDAFSNAQAEYGVSITQYEVIISGGK